MNPFIPTLSSVDSSMYLDQPDMQSDSDLGGLVSYLRSQGAQPGEAMAPALPAPAGVTPDLTGAGIAAGASTLATLGKTLAEGSQQRAQQRFNAQADLSVAKQRAEQKKGAANFKSIADLIANYRASL